jgi:RHS repeat-associated protein
MSRWFGYGKKKQLMVSQFCLLSLITLSACFVGGGGDGVAWGFSESNKSGTRAGATALPGAGGSVQKQKGDLSTNLFRGQVGFKIPLKVPAGNAGHAPELAISYDTGLGLGAFGLGWQLALPSIERSTTFGVPTYQLSQNTGFADILTVNGTRIKFISHKDGVYRYRLEKDFGYTSLTYYSGEFSLREHDFPGGGWVLARSSGEVLVFHQTACGVVSDLVATNPGGDCKSEVLGEQRKIQAWKLTHQINNHGRVIHYTYQKLQGQLVLNSITYGGINNDINRLQFYPLLKERPDPTFDYKAGFKRQKNILFGKVKVFHRGIMQRKYCFVYRSGVSATSEGNPLIHSDDCGPTSAEQEVLGQNEVTQSGQLHTMTYLVGVLSDASDSPHQNLESTFPAISFDYSAWFREDIAGNRKKLVYPVRGFNRKLISGSQSFNELLDINADGLPDIISNKAQKLAGLTNPGQLGEDVDIDFVKIANLSFPVSLGSDRQNLADLNGDGLVDFIVVKGRSLIYYQGTGDEKVFENRPHQLVLPEGWDQGRFAGKKSRIIDINGDGLADVLSVVKSGQKLYYDYLLNLGGKEFVNYTQPVEKRFLAGYNAAYFSQYWVRMSDANGDGLMDIIHLESKGLRIYYNRGNFGERDKALFGVDKNPADNLGGHFVAIDNRTGYDLKKSWFIDANGDGLVDLVGLNKFNRYSVQVRLNRGQGIFNQKIDFTMQVRDFPLSNNPRKSRISDIDGDGQQELLFASGRNLFMMDFNRQEDPDTEFEQEKVKQLIKSGLLTKVQYESGKRIDLQYATSTDEFLRDKAQGKSVATKLPFPMVLVKRVATTEGKTQDHIIKPMSARVQEFLYHNGAYYAPRRQFMGFSQVEMIEYGDDSQEMVYQLLEYANAGTKAQLQQYLLAGQLLKTTTYSLRDMNYLQTQFKTRRVKFDSAFVHSLSHYALNQSLPQLPEFFHKQQTNIYKAVEREEGVWFLYSQQMVESHHEGKKEAARKITTTNDVDKYGNIIETKSLSELLGPFQRTDVMRIRKDFSQVENELRFQHIYDRPSVFTVTNGMGKKLQETRKVYAAATGDVLLEENWVEKDRYAKTQYQYDHFGNQVLRIDPNGGHNRLVYGENGIFPVINHNGEGHETRLYYRCHDLPGGDDVPLFQCRERGLVTMARDARGLTRVFEYDELDRIKRVAATSGAVMKFRYLRGVEGLPNRTWESVKVKSNPEQWYRKVYFYRPNGDKMAIVAQAREGKVRIHDRFQFNRRGKKYVKYVPYMASMSVEEAFQTGILAPVAEETKAITSRFDLLGRELTTQYPNGKWESFSYHPYGYHFTINYKSATGENKSTTFENFFDARGKIIAITNPFGATVQVKRDALNRITELRNTSGVISTKLYNGLNKLTELNDPHIGLNQMEYDDNGRVVVKTLMNTAGDLVGKIRFQYDLLGRVLKKFHNQRLVEEFSYDSAMVHPDKTHCDLSDSVYGFNVGKATKITIHDQKHPMTILLGFNDRGKIGCEKKIIDGVVYSQQYQHDLFGRNDAVVDAHGYLHQYQHGEDNFLSSIDGVIDHLEYNEKGQIQDVHFRDDKLITRYQYDPSTLRVKRIFTTKSDGQLLQDLSYALDGRDNIEEVVDHLAGMDQHLDLSASYSYDEMSQLLSYKRGEKNYQYDYDENYNFVLNENFSRDKMRPSKLGRPYLPTGTNASPYEFDLRGNLASSPNLKSVTWSLDGRLQSATTREGKTVHYSYDHMGKRYAKTVTMGAEENPSSSARVYPFKEAYFEGNLKVSFIYAGNDRLARVEHRSTGPTMMWYVRDHLTGSNLVVDATTLKLVEQVGYHPYGTEYGKKDNYQPNPDITHRFTGNYFDFDLGLYLLGARFYDPKLGRFISPDPLYLTNWERGLKSIIELNLYQYAANNPMKYVDPTGKHIRVTRSRRRGRTTYTIRITAVLVNETGSRISRRQMRRYRRRMRRAIVRAYTRRYGRRVRLRARVSIRIARPGASRRSFGRRHVIHLVNSVPGHGSSVIGLGPFGRRDVWINRSILNNPAGSTSGSIEKTVPHEFGHSATLRHPNDPNNPLSGLGSNNLMWQTWASPSGTHVTLQQVRQMYRNYRAGRLNHR